MEDFNSEPSDEQVIESFYDSYNLHNLVKEKRLASKAHQNVTTQF